jgi:NADPH:quinone reductase-like Zn-dependent oxidoreductase
VDKPVPKDDEVLIAIHAASINRADWYALTGKPFMIRIGGGLLKPKHRILGMDVAGRVEAVGRNITLFQPGDEVFGDISWRGKGAFAEYVSVPEELLTLKPSNLVFDEAAAFPVAAVVALQGLRDAGQVKSGQTVLINGASGGVGTFAVQIAKSFGAEVTAVCSTRNVDIARSIGADHVIDYTREDFTRGNNRYDLIIGANGYHSLSDYKRALRPQGTYVCTGGTLSQIIQSEGGASKTHEEGKKVRSLGSVKQSLDDLVVVKELIEAGKVVPVIDRRFPLSETAEAFRYYGEGRSRGKVIITVGHTR